MCLSFLVCTVESTYLICYLVTIIVKVMLMAVTKPQILDVLTACNLLLVQSECSWLGRSLRVVQGPRLLPYCGFTIFMCGFQFSEEGERDWRRYNWHIITSVYKWHPSLPLSPHWCGLVTHPPPRQKEAGKCPFGWTAAFQQWLSTKEGKKGSLGGQLASLPKPSL